MDAVQALTAADCAVGESPVWREAESSLYWVDIPARTVHRLHPASGARASWVAPEMVACIAFDRTGRLVAGMETGIFSLELRAGGVAAASRLAEVAMPMPLMRFNDGRCDRQGRFWAGTMHMDMPAAHDVGALYRYTPQGLVGPLQYRLLTQNGLAWSPDGRTMYLSDSHPKSRRVWSFDYETDTGTPRNRRPFVDMNEHPGRPDGAAVDADGCYWTCANDAGKLLRFTPAGRLDRTLELPVAKPSMCAFGGPGYRTLFVTSIRPGEAAALAGQPLAGAVFAVDAGVAGLPEPEYQTQTA